MKTAVYLRKSRAEEAVSPAETLSRHRAALEELAKAQGLQIVRTYEEIVSGESLYSRPQMLRLLEEVEKGLYDAVLCMDIDRLGRGGMRDQGIILDAFKYSGTLIITPDRTYDLSDETDEELTEFKTFLSRRELKIINRRLRRGIKQTVLDGGYLANPPYGYRRATVNRRPSLAIVEEEAAFVRMIFSLYVEERVGCTAIANQLNLLGAHPRRGEVFSRSSVRKILTNPVYIGKVVWDRTHRVRTRADGASVEHRAPSEWTVSKGLHPPIVSEQVFSQAESIRLSRSLPPANTGVLKNPLAGLLFCARCGKRLQRIGMNKGTPYLACPTPGCSAAVRCDLLEEALLAALSPTLEAVQLPEQPVEAGGMRQQRILLCQRELHLLEEQRQRLYPLLERGIYDEKTFLLRNQELTHRHRALQTELATLSEKEDRCAKRQGIPKQKSARTAYQAADASGKNQILKCLIESISYQKEKKSLPRQFTLQVKLRGI